MSRRARNFSISRTGLYHILVILTVLSGLTACGGDGRREMVGITNLAPGSGPVGTVVTINGTGFGTMQRNSNVTFNGTLATVTSWSAASLTTTVPAGATTGNVVVTVDGVASNGANFTVATPPAIASLNPTSGPVGGSVTITGTNFGSTQGTSTVTFNGITAAVTSWAATSLTTTVPVGATTGNVVVTVNGIASNGVTFTVTPPPTIVSLNPSVGPVGGTVTIAGTNFGLTQGTSTVAFNGITAAVTSWAATSLTTTVPVGATTGNVVVTVNGLASNAVTFTVTPPPAISSLNPKIGTVGGTLTIAGTNFGATQGSSTLTLHGIVATVKSWTASSITATVPRGATTGNVVVTVDGVASNAVTFIVTPPPAITSLNPTSGPVGGTVTITGIGFDSPQGASTVTFNGIVATVTNWTSNRLTATVPQGATTGNVEVTVDDVTSNGLTFTVTPPPTITNLKPTSGAVGAAVTITGTNFGLAQGTSTLTFNGIAASVVSWSPTSIAATVPSGATTGDVVVTIDKVASNGELFTVTATWGTMDEWLQMDTSSPGTVLTTEILNAGTVGTPVAWSLRRTPLTGFDVAASQGGMGGSITVAGVTYPVGTKTQSMSLDHGQAAPITVEGIVAAGGAPTVVANGFITFGPPNATFAGRDFDMVVLGDPLGHYAVLQLNNGDADGAGGCYCVRIETDGNGTLHSSNTAITPGHRYSFSLLFDEVGGISKLALFDPSNNFAQVGSTMMVAQMTGNSFDFIELGNNEVGMASGATSFFEDIMLDWTNHVFPNFPSISK